MLLERDRSAHIIAISQEAFTDSILARFNLLTKFLPRSPRLSNPITLVWRKASRGPPSRVRYARTQRYDFLRT